MTARPRCGIYHVPERSTPTSTASSNNTCSTAKASKIKYKDEKTACMNRGAKSLSLSGAAYFSISPAVCMPRQKNILAVSLRLLIQAHRSQKNLGSSLPDAPMHQTRTIHLHEEPFGFLFIRRRHFPPAVCIHPGGGRTKNAKLFTLPLAACLSRKTFFLY